MRAFLIPIACLVACSAASTSEGQSFDAKTRALDGDTIAADFRLLGVDAFERGQMCRNANGCWPCGKAAQDLAARSVRDRNATITLTRSVTYGRPVATVSVGGADLGETMIRAGLAIPEPRFLRGDVGRAARYEAAYADAQKRRAGALGGQWIAPSSWRHGERLTCER